MIEMAAATEDDVAVADAIAGYPSAAVECVGRGVFVEIPEDWRERITRGEVVAGVTVGHAIGADGVLRMKDEDAAKLDADGTMERLVSLGVKADALIDAIDAVLMAAPAVADKETP